MSSLSIKREFTPPSATPMAAQTEEAEAAARARRAELVTKARQEHQEGVSVFDETETEAAPREDVDSVEVQLPCGLVEFGPPAGVSLTMRIATFPDVTARSTMVLRVLMYVRAIDGKPMRAITNMTEAQRLANIIGDRYIDYLADLMTTYWPPINTADLPVIKKNLR